MYIDFLKQEYERISEYPVKLVAIPLPPTPVGNVLFLPNAFASKTYDREFDLDETGFKLITADFHPQLGIVLLLITKLKHLIDWKGDLLNVHISTFCAGVSFYEKRSENGLIWADEVVLDSLTSIHRSCHPGSHYIIPRSPSLTALLQFVQAPDTSDADDDRLGRQLFNFTYLLPIEGENLFPTARWSGNELIEDYVKQCPADVSIFRTVGGPGQWAKDVLRCLSLNRLVFG